MARSRDSRRRVAVLVVMLIAAAATIATSQPIVQSRLERSAEATVVLDDASPRAVGRFVLMLSLETLPVGSATAPAPDGDVTFTIAVDGGAGAGAGSSEAVSITASAVGIPQPPLTVSGNPTWPIEELCRVAEPCRREFEVAVE